MMFVLGAWHISFDLVTMHFRSTSIVPNKYLKAGRGCLAFHDGSIQPNVPTVGIIVKVLKRQSTYKQPTI